MPQPIKLTYAEVVEAGRKAYLAGELSAQGPTPECDYRDISGRPCVVGAAMSDAVAINLRGDIQYLAHVGKVNIAEDELLPITALQVAHDLWAVAVDNDFLETAREHEAELRKLLNIEEAA